MEKRLINYEDLTKSEKAEHIWEYYKVHIIGVGIGLILVFTLLNHYIFNPPAERTFDISIFGDFGDAEVMTELEEALQSIIVKDGENEEVSVEFFSIAEDQNYEAQQATVTKMIGKATLHEFDIMIFEGDFYQNYLQEDALLSLNNMIDTGIINVDEEKLIKGSDVDFDSEDYYLINLNDHEGFNRMLNNGKDVYLAIFAASNHPEHINEAIDYVLNEFK